MILHINKNISLKIVVSILFVSFNEYSFAKSNSCNIKGYSPGSVVGSNGIPISQEDACKQLEIALENILMPITFSSNKNNSKNKNSFKIERFYYPITSTYDILEKYKLSMKFEDLIKNCSYRENIGKYKSIHLEAFDCNTSNMPTENSISLVTYHYPEMASLQIASIIFKTCSPTWMLIKQALVDKYSNSSENIVDYKDFNSGNVNKITFRVSKISPERITGEQKERKDCSSGLGLQLSLVNESDLLNYFEEISKNNRDNKANKTPIPKF